MKRKFLFTLTLLAGTFSIKANDTLTIINPHIKEIQTREQCILQYKVVSKAKTKVQFNDYLNISEWNTPDADVWVLLEKKEKDAFVKVDFRPLIDVISTQDAEKIKYLSFNDTMTVKVDLKTKYLFLSKGEYRLNLLIRASKNNKMNDVKADPLYFKLGIDL